MYVSEKSKMWNKFVQVILVTNFGHSFILVSGDKICLQSQGYETLMLWPVEK